MRYFQPYVFFVFVAINVTSTLFCAQEEVSKEIFPKKDPFGVYCARNLGGPQGARFIKERAERFRQRLSKTCREKKPPISFALYCKMHRIDKTHVLQGHLLTYSRSILGPWAIEAREWLLKRRPSSLDLALNEGLKARLPSSMIGIVKGYVFEPTVTDHGVDGEHELTISQGLLDPLIKIKIVPTTTFGQFISAVAGQAKEDINCVTVYSARNSLPIESIRDLVYESLLGEGSLTLEKPEYLIFGI